MDRQTPHDQPRSVVAYFLNLQLAQPTMVGLTMRYELDDEVWVGVCEELGTSTYDSDLDAGRGRKSGIAHERLTLARAV